MDRKIIRKPLLITVFVLLLASPVMLKPESPGKDRLPENQEQALEQYGFYLTDVTAETGINFKHHTPVLDKKIEHILPQIASVGASVSVCDYDNDGWFDLYFTNSRTGTRNALYHNNKDGTFTDIAGKLGIADVNRKGTGVSMGAVWGDFDNDGFEDLFIYKWGKPELFRNTGGNGFEPVTDKSNFPARINANTAIWFDADNDGLLDLFIGGYYDEKIDLWNLSDTRIMPESYEYANNGGRNYLFKNKGEGLFVDVTSEYGLDATKWTLASAAADMNGDTYPELIVANDYGIDQYYINVDGKRFTEAGRETGIGFTPKSGMNVSFGDVDNSGKPGIYISNITETGILMQGNNLWIPEVTEKGMTYRNEARMKGVEFGGWCYGARFGDLNNNGFLDLYVANGYISALKGVSYWYDYSKVSGGNKSIISDAANWPPMEGKSQSGYQQNMIWLNKGGVFEDISTKVTSPLTRDSRSIVYADLWNRGVLDIVVASQSDLPVIYRNHVDPACHWIEFDPEGVKSNRSAFGTIITLYWNGQKQTQILTGGSGFSGQNQHRIHFGTGRTSDIDKAIIRWPSGKVQTVTHPATDKLYKIMEGEPVKPTDIS